MGKGRKCRSAINLLDVTSDDDSVSSTSTGWSEPAALAHVTEQVNSREDELEKHIDALYEKRASTREKALVGLIEAFESSVLVELVEKKTFTLLQQFINCIKRGSSKEISLASRAIGLLDITVGSSADTHEIMVEAVPHLHQALKSGTDQLKKTAVLSCLAVITFIGSDSVDDTASSMKILWELIHPKSASNVTLPKPTPAILSSAIAAWSFLLTTVIDWRNNSINWQEAISFLSNQLDKDDRSVRIAAGEALALIFEIDRLEKFSNVDNSEATESGNEGYKPHTGFGYIEALKGKILNQARDLSMEAGGKGSAKTDLNSQRELFQRVLYFIETGEFEEISVKVLNNCSPLILSTWAESVRLNFLKRFLGSGYLKHMLDNVLLHEIFDFKPKKRENLSVVEKRMYMSPNSVAKKERTQYLNKRRAWARDKNQGQFAVGGEDY